MPFGNETPEQKAARLQKTRETWARKRLAKASRKAAQSEAEDVSLPSGYNSQVDLEEPEVTTPAGDSSDPYQMWLLALDQETKAMFSEAELRATFAEYWAKAQAEKKVKKKKEIQDLALSTARSQMGLMPAQTVEQLAVARQNARPVSMVIQLPPAQDNGAPADVGLRVNGQVIENGKRVFCTYGEAASYREMLYRHGQHELLFKGQNIRYRSWLLGQAMGSVNTLIDANERGVIR